MLANAIIGREEELGQVRDRLGACLNGPAALALAGEPGIGKTVLWEAGVAEARARGFRVLVHRSVEAEAGFAFAGLSDLVAPVFDEVADELATPRRAALEVALLLADADDRPAAPHAIGLALLDVLRLLAREAPVLVALDDLQWFDPSSASVVPAALRRLEHERVGLLATVRGTPAALRAWEPVGLRVQSLEPLGIGELHSLLRDRLGVELPRPQVTRLHGVSGGNPYFALELARTPDGGVPESLRDLLGGRIAGLPPETGDVLLLAAALARPTEDLVCAAHGEPRTAHVALEAAGDVLVSDGDRLRFAHPLLASLCYQRAAPTRRRDAHRRLAAVVSDVEERARHLALAVTEPDAQVAAELDIACARAAARGAALAAAELAQLAVERTPPQDVAERRRRRLGGGRLLWLAGDLQHASTIHQELLAETASGPERADLLHVIALSGGLHVAERARMCEQAVAEAGDDDARAVELLAQAATYRWLSGDTETGLARARDGLARAVRRSDARLLAIAEARVGDLETYALDVTPGLLERAVVVETTLDTPLPFYQSPRAALGVRMIDLGDPRGGRAILEEYVAADDEAAEHTRGFAYPQLVLAEWQLGRWDAAIGYARALRDFAEQARDPVYRGIADLVSALAEADRGLLDDARAHAESARRISARMGDEIDEAAAEAVLGHIELLGEDPSAAARRLRGLPDRFLRSGFRQGGTPMAWSDAIEALSAVGETDEAAARLAQYEPIADIAGGLHRIAVARVRGLVAAARGDTAGAVAALEEALAADAPPTFPFERARALLTLGGVQRRARRQSAARQNLERALTVFEELGAVPWVARACDELRRVSGRRATGDDLTEAEQRVAALAASGRRNKEIAARLFVQVGTVEAHLSRVYRKLGVRSRTELAARIDAGGNGPSNV